MQLPDVLNNENRFIFNNWSTEDFIGKWDSKEETIKAGETKDLPAYKAYHYTKHLVNREMAREGKSGLLGNDDARSPYEEKTIVAISGDTESLALSSLKEKIKKEIEETQSPKKEMEVKKTETSKEFEDLNDAAL